MGLRSFYRIGPFCNLAPFLNLNSQVHCGGICIHNRAKLFVCAPFEPVGPVLVILVPNGKAVSEMWIRHTLTAKLGSLAKMFAAMVPAECGTLGFFGSSFGL